MSVYSNVATGGFAITTSDTAEFSGVWLYVGGAGDIKVKTADGNELTFVAFPAGGILPVTVKKVFATGTTATSMIGLTK